MAYLRKKTVKDERYLYLVESLWDTTRKTSRQKIIKYLGKESSVTIDDIPKDYRDSKNITNYFTSQKYFDPKNHQDTITKTKNDLLLSLREGDTIGSYSLYERYDGVYGSEEFLEKILRPTIEEIEKISTKQENDLALQTVSYKTIEDLLEKILNNTTPKTKNKKILICLPYGEQHSLGAQVIESSLSLMGHQVYNLPPLSSTSEILETIKEKNPDCVFISVTLDENILGAKRLESRIQENFVNPIFIGGQAYKEKNQLEKNTLSEERLSKIYKLIFSKGTHLVNSVR